MFARLRHHAVVGSDHQDDDVGRFRAPGTHRGERLVARRIEESEHAARRLDVVRADVLRDAARFTGSDFCSPDVVEQRRLAVVDVTHDRDDRGARLDRGVVMRFGALEVSIRVVELRGERLVPHFLDQDHGRFLVQHLVDRHH